MFKFIDKAADRPDRRVLVACFELINMRAKLIKTAYIDSADFTDHVQICFSSVSRLQENIFADDEGNASATDWKQTFKTIKWSVASLFFVKQICCRSAADLLVSYGRDNSDDCDNRGNRDNCDDNDN